MHKFKTILAAALALAVSAAAVPTVASADTTWLIENATFSDGTLLTGTFSINQYGYLAAANLTTEQLGIFQSETYDITSGVSTGGLSAPYYINFNLDGGQEDLHVVFTDPLTTPGGHNGIVLSNTSYECQNAYACVNESGGDFRYLTSGYATTSVPEPAAWALMLVGVGLVGAGLRFRREKQGLAVV